MYIIAAVAQFGKWRLRIFTSFHPNQNLTLCFLDINICSRVCDIQDYSKWSKVRVSNQTDNNGN